MLMEIIKISAAIVLGSIALSIILFVFFFCMWFIQGMIQGAKEALEEKSWENIKKKYEK